MSILAKKRELLLGNLDNELDDKFLEKLNGICDLEIDKLENIENLSIDEVKLRYKSIVEVLKAYNTKNTKIYDNEQILKYILDKIKYLRENYYNLDTKEKDNWWHYEIGIPVLLNEIFILLPKNEKVLDEMNKSLEVSEYFQKDPRYSGNNKVAIHPSGKPFRKSLGANRVDTVKISLYRASLLNKCDEIKLALDSIKEVIDVKKDISAYEKKEDRVGFYEDGSFIQHEIVAYNGTYGNVLLSGFSEILYVIKGTEYEIILYPYRDKLLNIVFNSFEPFFYEGAFTDALNGRSITRENSSDMKVGHLIINSFILLSKTINNKNLNYVIEREINRASYKYDYLKEENQVFYYYLIKEIMEKTKNNKYIYDKNIKICKNMARVFVRNDNYAFCISSYSKYICNYESMNNENLKGYYTGDCMYYLYTKNNTYVDYWNNVDMDYMSGTIEIHSEINENISMITKNNNLKIDKTDYGFSLDCNFKNWNDELKTDKSILYENNEITIIEKNIDTNKNIYLTLSNLLYYSMPNIEKINENEYKVNGIRYILDKNYGKVCTELKQFNNKYFFKIWIEVDKNVKNIKWKIKL